MAGNGRSTQGRMSVEVILPVLNEERDLPRSAFEGDVRQRLVENDSPVIELPHRAVVGRHEEVAALFGGRTAEQELLGDGRLSHG